ncbi:MAG: LysM peptidoglycan-binding domain-containing protein [Cryobacterium sp.]|nr:LysM peptidoglycan-binding domain-containing protein [Cryobacterium sp.]
MTTALVAPAIARSQVRLRYGVARAPQPRLRLTRRGRAVLSVLVAGFVLVLALALSLNGGMATATSELSSGSFHYVTVEAGQSLWQLAETIAPGADPRDVISDIVHLNQLQSSVVHPGERLAIPLQYER